MGSIFSFESYSDDPKLNIADDDIKNLISALTNQYGYLYYNEQTFELYKLIKDRTQQFWIEEFSFLGDLPAFRSKATWVGGISIRPMF